MSPKFIYFDLDDTLLDHGQAERNALQDVHEEFELFADIPVSTWQQTYRSVNKTLWAQYSQGKIDREDLEKARFRNTMVQLGLNSDKSELIGQTYMECYRHHWYWVEGARDVFHEIAERYPVGIITNGFAETQRLKFEKFDLSSVAKPLIITEEVGEMKPHPKVFNHAISLIDAGPAEILYVGDNLISDIRGGNNAGWKTAWFVNGSTEKNEEADFHFSEFSELRQLLI